MMISYLANAHHSIIPAKAGIPLLLSPAEEKRDPCFRGDDEIGEAAR